MLLTTARDGDTDHEVRARLVADAAEIGGDLHDRATMPAAPSAAA